MLFNRLKFFVSTVSLCLLAGYCPVSAETAADPKDEKGPRLNLEEMRSHRTMLRTDLMIPSLSGIRGIAYGVPGSHPIGELEKVVETAFKQMPVQSVRYQDLKSGETKPIDAFLQLKVLGAGDRFSVVELTLYQWCTLTRDPSISVKTITYTDQVVTSNPMIKDTCEKILNQFVLDYLKANQAGSKKEASVEGEKSDKAASKKKKGKGAG